MSQFVAVTFMTGSFWVTPTVLVSNVIKLTLWVSFPPKVYAGENPAETKIINRLEKSNNAEMLQLLSANLTAREIAK
jgi:hypothetical protein